MLKTFLSRLFPVSINDWKTFLGAIDPDYPVEGIIKGSKNSYGFSYRVDFRAQSRDSVTVSYNSPVLVEGVHVPDKVKLCQVMLQVNDLAVEVRESVPGASVSIRTRYGTQITPELLEKARKAVVAS